MAKQEPRIILWDLETVSNLPEAMKVFPSLGDYPGLTLKASINSIICFGWKELNKKTVHCVNAWDFKTRWKKNINDDYSVVKAAYNVLKDAQVVVTHNGKRFDWRFLQTRLAFHGLPHLPPIIHIDTCMEAKKHLFLFNNRLNTLAKFMTDKTKDQTGGWDLWVDVSNRKKSALAKMSKYCKQDVLVLEEIFNKLRPMIRGLPNQNMLMGTENCCPNCGSSDMQRRGIRVQKEKIFQRLQCQDCGSWSTEQNKKIKEL